MSKRLIYAEDVIFALEALFAKQIKQFDYESYEKADEKTQLVCDGISESIGCLLDLPSENLHTAFTQLAQPEIIRCKDCKWFNTAGCVIEIVYKSGSPTEDGSCSFAERIDDE